jgi:hypothetical protein
VWTNFNLDATTSVCPGGSGVIRYVQSAVRVTIGIVLALALLGAASILLGLTGPF